MSFFANVIDGCLPFFLTIFLLINIPFKCKLCFDIGRDVISNLHRTRKKMYLNENKHWEN